MPIIHDELLADALDETPARREWFVSLLRARTAHETYVPFVSACRDIGSGAVEFHPIEHDLEEIWR